MRRFLVVLAWIPTLFGCGDGEVAIAGLDTTPAAEDVAVPQDTREPSFDAILGNPNPDAGGTDTAVGVDTAQPDTAPPCQDACQIGPAQCVSANTLEHCKIGPSGCLEWVSEACGAEQSCERGACVGTCQHGCSSGQTRCAGESALETCEIGISGCLEWLASPCRSGEVCSGGSCAVDCQGGCTPGQRRCSGSRIEVCQANGDGCLTWASASTCPTGEVCSGGTCVPPADPGTRTQAEVCGRWTRDFPWTTPANFQSQSTCDPGTVAPGAFDDAIRRVNVYRYLVGLPDVAEDLSRRDAMQECAVMQANNDGPSSTVNAHFPPNTWDCYTSAAAGASGSSNLSWGVYHPAEVVSQFIADRGVPSLGHRLWTISPGMGKTTFGFATGGGRYRAAACMYSFDRSGGARVDFVAFPPPGPVPMEAITSYNVSDWSFTSSKYSTSGVTEVTLTRLSDGDVQVLTPRRISGYGHPSGLAFAPRRPSAGETYTVDLGGVFSYQVQFVDCP